MGHHNIRRLQVTMDNLLLMDIRQSLCQFFGDTPSVLKRWMAAKIVTQRTTINPLRNNTYFIPTTYPNMLHAKSLHDSRMLKLHQNLELLTKHLLIDRVGRLFRLQTLKQEPSPITFGSIEVTITWRRQGCYLRKDLANAFKVGGHITGNAAVGNGHCAHFFSNLTPPCLPQT